MSHFNTDFGRQGCIALVFLLKTSLSGRDPPFVPLIRREFFSILLPGYIFVLIRNWFGHFEIHAIKLGNIFISILAVKARFGSSLVSVIASLA